MPTCRGSGEAVLVNQHQAAIKAARGNERGREKERERIRARERESERGLERESSALESLDNFTLLMHVTLLRSTIGSAHATLKRRARNAGVFNGAKRERVRKKARKGGHSAPFIISLVMARTDNSSPLVSESPS